MFIKQFSITSLITSLGSKFHIKAVRIKKEYLLTLQSTCVINNMKSWPCILIMELIALDLYVKKLIEYKLPYRIL